MNTFFLKKVIYLILLCGVTSAVCFLILKTKCLYGRCDIWTREGLVLPVFWMSLTSLGILFVFLFFKNTVFSLWLKHIAWWYILGLVLLVLNTPVFSGNIYHVDRSVLVVWGMGLLFVITIPYALWQQKKLGGMAE